MNGLPDEGLSGEELNEKYNLPCPYNPKVKCIQIPDDGCGCDWCTVCPNEPSGSEFWPSVWVWLSGVYRVSPITSLRRHKIIGRPTPLARNIIGRS